MPGRPRTSRSVTLTGTASGCPFRPSSRASRRSMVPTSGTFDVHAFGAAILKVGARHEAATSRPACHDTSCGSPTRRPLTARISVRSSSVSASAFHLDLGAPRPAAGAAERNPHEHTARGRVDPRLRRPDVARRRAEAQRHFDVGALGPASVDSAATPRSRPRVATSPSATTP